MLEVCFCISALPVVLNFHHHSPYGNTKQQKTSLDIIYLPFKTASFFFKNISIYYFKITAFGAFFKNVFGYMVWATPAGLFLQTKYTNKKRNYLHLKKKTITFRFNELNYKKVVKK